MIDKQFTLSSDSIALAIANKMLALEVEESRKASNEYDRLRREAYPKVRKAFDKASYTALIQHDDIIEATLKILSFYRKEEIPEWKVKVTYDCLCSGDDDNMYVPIYAFGFCKQVDLSDKNLKKLNKLKGEIQFVPVDEEDCAYCWKDIHQYSIKFEYDNPITIEENRTIFEWHNKIRHIDTAARLKELVAEYTTAVVSELVGMDTETSTLVDRIIQNQKLLKA